MYFIDFIRPYIEQLLQSEYPVYFYWDRMKSINHPYVVYQTEDLELSNKLETEYETFLNNAIQVYDYSEKNLVYRNSIFKPLLPDLNLEHSLTKEKDIEVLFYGLMTPRRQEIINSLEYSVYYKQNLTWDEMKDLISRSKWVLSIGSYSNLHNDLLRITPALNLGANIILENTQESWYNNYLQKHFKHRIQII